MHAPPMIPAREADPAHEPSPDAREPWSSFRVMSMSIRNGRAERAASDDAPTDGWQPAETPPRTHRK
jgi:hypothetical protein